MRKYLKTLRTTKNLTQAEVAKELDISESYFCLIEKGERKESLSVSVLCKLAEVFNVPVSDLIEAERKFSEKAS